MKYYARIDTVTNFVKELFAPHDEFDLAPDIVEISEAAYSESIASGEVLTDYKVLGMDLVLDVDSQAETIRLEQLAKDKTARDEALNNLIHDFGDGRIMQVRPKDESNIRNAIEVMTTASMTTIGWVMLDDKKYNVTVPELQTALASGQAQALTIWENFNP